MKQEQEYAEFAEKTGLIKSELSLDESFQLCKLFKRYKEIWDLPDEAPIVYTDAMKFKIEFTKPDPFRQNYQTRDPI